MPRLPLAVDFATTNVPFAVSTLVDVVVVGGAILSRRAWLLAVAVGVLAVAVGVLATKGLAMMAAGLDQFGVAHVLWLDLVVALPIAGVVAFAVWRRPVAAERLARAPPSHGGPPGAARPPTTCSGATAHAPPGPPP